jgi:hypothetical protein
MRQIMTTIFPLHSNWEVWTDQKSLVAIIVLNRYSLQGNLVFLSLSGYQSKDGSPYKNAIALPQIQLSFLLSTPIHILAIGL